VAYKRDVDDVRESPAIDVMRLLEADGANVSYHDPHVPIVLEDGKSVASVELTADAMAGADAVVILTDHSAFDYDWIVANSHVLIDARHAVPRDGRTVGSGWVVKS
jgi:UDP-N-acetyl-D-glucosamine dehydrogenase